ncbi:DNA-binding protein [Salinigranum rubrum]|uniref:DNA-binding protein n=1 Tax=Salinigranum rubrum TaxID=755307 RepID=A0A2I8VM48_9EURY|nr:OB-fold nucleic acid binding domain-containing protein [Salinigranum rubrum]AUV82159.1 DNA-binding protein [Salinigranum rubrum]
MDWITHEEDVWFDFRGERPDQLTAGRFYRGTVDGFAEFGVFVDLSPSVTGLLHRSELDRRLESLDWDRGDTVFVQVKNIRDNGNVDLGWSIRQSESEFRGARIDDPDGDPEGEPLEVEERESSKPVKTRPKGNAENESSNDDDSDLTATDGDAANGRVAEADDGARDEGGHEPEPEPEPEAAASGDEDEPVDADAFPRVAIGDLDDRVGDDVSVEGFVVDVYQTSGPTVFEVRDETGTVECAAFVEAGVRAYPEVEDGDAVRLAGEVELRRGELQIETEALDVLDDEEAAAVQGRLDDAMTSRARPDSVEPLAEHAALEALVDEVADAAEAIRRAVFDARPIVVRHAATADGYVAGAAIERAVLPLIREEYSTSDAEYHYFTRRPLDEPMYGMDAATNDVTRMLQGQDRHDEKLPLVLLVGTGSTVESTDGLGLLGVYGARRVVLDAATADEEVADVSEVLVDGGESGELSTGALAANVAAAVNAEVRDDLLHLPAVSYWEQTPTAYVEAAAEAGYDADRVREMREAVALEAYYQSYQDKRELITDLLFEDGGGLAGHVSEQFRIKLDAEVDTAEANLETREAGGAHFAVLDTDSYTHRFDFPPTTLLLDEIHRRNRVDDAPFVTVGVGTDELHIRSTAPVDIRAVAAAARETVPGAGVTAFGIRDGRIEFLSGMREDVLNAVVAAIAEQI